ncbi:hypothetical protein ERJ75_000636000 [Trypanosoma vivax]|nr:hypothetical protein ERJ75_000636000 [Trypanosoma vivax]
MHGRAALLVTRVLGSESLSLPASRERDAGHRRGAVKRQRARRARRTERGTPSRGGRPRARGGPFALDGPMALDTCWGARQANTHRCARPHNTAGEQTAERDFSALSQEDKATAGCGVTCAWRAATSFRKERPQTGHTGAAAACMTLDKKPGQETNAWGATADFGGELDRQCLKRRKKDRS